MNARGAILLRFSANTVLTLIIPAGIIIFLRFLLRELLEGGRAGIL